MLFLFCVCVYVCVCVLSVLNKHKREVLYVVSILLAYNNSFGLVWFLFYGPSTHFRSFRARSVNLATLFLGKPPWQFTST